MANLPCGIFCIYFCGPALDGFHPRDHSRCFVSYSIQPQLNSSPLFGIASSTTVCGPGFSNAGKNGKPDPLWQVCGFGWLVNRKYIIVADCTRILSPPWWAPKFYAYHLNYVARLRTLLPGGKLLPFQAYCHNVFLTPLKGFDLLYTLFILGTYFQFRGHVGPGCHNQANWLIDYECVELYNFQAAEASLYLRASDLLTELPQPCGVPPNNKTEASLLCSFAHCCSMCACPHHPQCHWSRKQELESFVGRLQHATKVFWLWRTFL